eukprot:7801649-Pyramimonas_sp.AAC.1
MSRLATSWRRARWGVVATPGVSQGVFPHDTREYDSDIGDTLACVKTLARRACQLANKLEQREGLCRSKRPRNSH